jgi:hypothetical protein
MRLVLGIIVAVTLFVTSAGLASANPSAPTNGGSANGGGQSGQCTGANADRPPSCHNGLGSGN